MSHILLTLSLIFILLTSGHSHAKKISVEEIRASRAVAERERRKGCFYGYNTNRDEISKMNTSDPIYEDLIEASGKCDVCGTASAFDKLGAFLKAKENVISNYKGSIYKIECAQAATKISSGTKSYICGRNNKPVETEDQCHTAELVAYHEFALSQATKCALTIATQLRADRSVLNPAHHFAMVTNEGTFKSNLASKAGVGFVQLASVSVADMHEPNMFGLKYLKAVAASTAPECRAFKAVAKADLENPPLEEKRGGDSYLPFCKFISPGEGITRNLLYSMGYKLNIWERYLKDDFAKYEKKWKGSPALAEIKALLVMNSYGADGMGASLQVMRKLSGLNPNEFIAAMKRPKNVQLVIRGRASISNLTEYIQDTFHKAQNVLKDKIANPALAEEVRTKGVRACLK